MIIIIVSLVKRIYIAINPKSNAELLFILAHIKCLFNAKLTRDVSPLSYVVAVIKSLLYSPFMLTIQGMWHKISKWYRVLPFPDATLVCIIQRLVYLSWWGSDDMLKHEYTFLVLCRHYDIYYYTSTLNAFKQRTLQLKGQSACK